jgi:D-alanyl-D-alanine carboxypeptidase/D-alanyl-D-alanine-endopeptidase (penicillin-binding protein 4)
MLMRWCALCLSLVALSLRAEPLPTSLTDALNRAGIPMSAVAAHVEKIGSGDVLVSHNSDASMNPASVMKLLTTFAALEMLGPHHHWRTEIYATGTQRGMTLEGDLHLRGTGDPKLNYERFWQLLKHLRARGIRSLHGDLVIDRSSFALPAHDPGRFDGEPLKAHNVGPDAALLNLKVVRFFFVPKGERVIVYAEPALAGVLVESQVRAVAGGCGEWRDRLTRTVESRGDQVRVRFSGNYATACGENAWNISLLGQDAYALQLFDLLWADLGGTHKGGVRSGSVPAGADLLYVHESPPLADVVRDINKFSNNVMARQVLLSLSAEPGKAASVEASDRLIRDWLRKKALSFPELVIENGSGLSRRERLSARSTVALLQAAWKSPVLGDFLASIPLVGSDGTMRRRAATDGGLGYAHIKGGTLTGVRTIAGYVIDRKGERWALALFINHPHAVNLQAAQDGFVRWVHER